MGDVNRKEIYIHVGMPKTGTTFLQNEIFPFLEDVYFSKQDVIMEIMNGLIVVGNPIFYDIELYKKKIYGFLEQTSQKKVLISFESLIGSVHANMVNMCNITEALKEIFPEAKILLTIRKQDEFAESLYKQLLHEGYSVSKQKYLFDLTGQMNMYYKFLDYYKISSFYMGCWGRDNVHVIPYELIRADRPKFLQRLQVYLAVDTINTETSRKVYNKSYSLVSSYMAMAFNRFLKRPTHSCGFITERPFYNYFSARAQDSKLFKVLRGISYRMTLRYLLQEGVDKVFYIKYQALSKHQKKQIIDFHCESNKLLDGLMLLDLAALGYYKKEC